MARNNGKSSSPANAVFCRTSGGRSLRIGPGEGVVDGDCHMCFRVEKSGEGEAKLVLKVRHIVRIFVSHFATPAPPAPQRGRYAA
jgi:hypothetical protein